MRALVFLFAAVPVFPLDEPVVFPPHLGSFDHFQSSSRLMQWARAVPHAFEVESLWRSEALQPGPDAARGRSQTPADKEGVISGLSQ